MKAGNRQEREEPELGKGRSLEGRGGAGRPEDPLAGRRDPAWSLASRPAAKGRGRRCCTETPPPPGPFARGTQAGRKEGVVEAAAALERSSWAPADPGSEDISPHRSSTCRQAVPSRYVPEQASRRGPAAGARGQRDLQVSTRIVGAEPGRAGSGGHERRAGEPNLQRHSG